MQDANHAYVGCVDVKDDEVGAHRTGSDAITQLRSGPVKQWRQGNLGALLALLQHKTQGPARVVPRDVVSNGFKVDLSTGLHHEFHPVRFPEPSSTIVEYLATKRLKT